MPRRRPLSALIVTALGLYASFLSPLAQAGTDPPPNFATFIPACYNATNGNVRFVKPWAVQGASIAGCTPPAPWNIDPPYDPAACNSGGAFDCRTGEFYTEFATFAGPGCVPGDFVYCYSGPAATLGVGICKAGTRTCTASGTWGTCDGEVLPRPETLNGLDDNCDGTVDNVDLCSGVTCNTPPPDTCSSHVLTHYLSPGVCAPSTGACSYSPVSTANGC
jgi:hypothetical protein